ncbi:siderophore synthetase [Staphylococcus equorum]|uniref:Siderophore synthetase n=1 Tax=Staphylococcus equorum TaxID=246432 RepID=A0A9X4R5Y6_9STAP|nr:IucA/IucC family protein [Staphylococcus equorum]MDG0844578.1 siderophore synthetase [Staphylococcus equorum]MDG0860818.1 siderophore synthetase [Staphylococcus equorum]
MMHQTWQSADKTVQYRIYNAIIKEHIFPDKMIVNEFEDCIELQYHGQLLQVTKARKNAMKRYVFRGVIRYIRGNAMMEIETVEQLLDVLDKRFDIPISNRLREELISSRDGFALTYNHFSNRQALIHATLKFSRMPETINFFTWLKHFEDSEEINDLTYSESIVVEGHPTHPLSKTKLPLTDEEVKLYAPEFEKIIALKVMLIHKADCITTSMEDDEQYILNHIIPEYRYKLKAFLEPYQFELDDYRVILVHPWQYDNVIVHQFSKWIKEGRLLPTPFDVESKATLSFRTMALINKPFHIKLPVNIQATSAVRTVSAVTTVDGPKLSYELQDMLELHPQLQVALEPYGIHVNIDDDTARQLACIVRHKPYIVDNGTTLVTASLVNKNPVDNKVVVDSYLEWIGEGPTSIAIKQFLSSYAKTLIEPLIAYIQDYGIALEAHMQNTIVNLGPNYQMKLIIRDLGGLRIDLETLKFKLPHIDVNNTSLIAENIESVIEKFQHSVIQNQIAELIHHFSKYEQVDETMLFELVGNIVDEAIDPQKAHAQVLKAVLFGPTISVKALLRMRMESKVKQYVTIKLKNPLYKEV